MGDLDSHDGICRFLAAQTNFVVVSINYRRSPEVRFPGPLDDCSMALKFISRRSKRLGLDMSRVVLAGDSAGGNMATVLANDPSTEVNGVGVIGQILLYPVTDFSSESKSYELVSDGFPLTARTMRWFKSAYVPLRLDLRDLRLSPLLNAQRRQPPMFIVTTGHDPLSNEGMAYASQAAIGGTSIVHHHLPEHMHGIFTSAGAIKTARCILKRAAEFAKTLVEENEC